MRAPAAIPTFALLSCLLALQTVLGCNTDLTHAPVKPGRVKLGGGRLVEGCDALQAGDDV